ncbi:MAG: HlyD family efflux transporter periplasmic adaptor subunit [Clostridia bacterium]|nr:HlyD family efflux transporter periplasmic adaptor subunit [Clostridia bacterium]
MKKHISLCLTALTLACLCPVALAEPDLSQYTLTDATVQAASHTDLTAPCAGTLLPFDLEAGDPVTAGQTLFTYLTESVTAPENGKVTALFAAAGDDAAAVSATYGKVASVEPANAMRIHASIAGAANEEENKFLHVGETLYFESTKSGKEKGTGRVIAVNGAQYTVEILSGTFENNETLTLYRNVNRTAGEKVGKGTVVRRDPVSVGAQGIITEVLAKEGRTVKAGETLFKVLPGCTEHGIQPVVQSATDGVVAQVAVGSGQPVAKGQLLCRIYDTESLELVAEVDEMDLRNVSVGSTVPFTLDTDPANILSGEVTEISALGVRKQNASYYTVRVKLYNVPCRLGQSASLYLPKS